MFDLYDLREAHPRSPPFKSNLRSNVYHLYQAQVEEKKKTLQNTVWYIARVFNHYHNKLLLPFASIEVYCYVIVVFKEKSKLVSTIMASMPTSKHLFLIYYVSLLLCFVSLSSSSSPSDLSGVSLPSSSKVSLSLYYESLCPACSSFIVDHLVKLFEDDLISIVDLHLSPWGNTYLRPDNVTDLCQVYFLFFSTVSDSFS